MAANKKWAILYCPKKGMYSRGVRWSKVERSLMDNGIEFDYVQSESIVCASGLLGYLAAELAELLV